VIVSNNSSNKTLERVQVLPISSNISKIYPCEVLIILKKIESKAMADQVMTISKKRAYKKLTTLNEFEMTEIERALKLQLKLN
jgi:mRNA interferase MazF